MIVLEPVTEDNAMMFKAVRLRALKDTPSAFGSTYAKEAQLTDTDWVARTKRWSGEQGMMYLAMDEEAGCGIAGAYLDELDATRAQLISMWTAPTHRQRGVGRLLVDALIEWARLRGTDTMQLMVTSKNDAAMLFYQRLGFAFTGRTGPYPNDAALIEYEMARRVSQ